MDINKEYILLNILNIQIEYTILLNSETSSFG